MIRDDINTLPLPDLFARLASTGLIERLLDIAHAEDLSAHGDVTSRACIPEDRPGVAHVVARRAGVVSGLAVLPLVAARFAPGVRVDTFHADGTPANPGDVLATFRGPLRPILAMERTALNLVGRLSGIASLTRSHVGAILPGSRATLYDTRKTTPGLRVLEKYAVRCGGGRCHRLGLHDALLIKDNHLAGVSTRDLPAFVTAAVARARALAPITFAQVEADTLDQVEALLTLPPGTIDIILLDNMSHTDMTRAARLRNDRSPGLELEASGGVTLGTIPVIAMTGVDRISVGALTHHAVSLDVALDIDPDAEHA